MSTARSRSRLWLQRDFEPNGTLLAHKLHLTFLTLPMRVSVPFLGWRRNSRSDLQLGRVRDDRRPFDALDKRVPVRRRTRRKIGLPQVRKRIRRAAELNGLLEQDGSVVPEKAASL